MSNLNLESSDWFDSARIVAIEMEFEDVLLNFKILFLKAEKVSEFLIFKSNLFHLMTVDGKKEFLKRLGLALNWGMLLLVLVLYNLLALESILNTPEIDL